MEPTVTPDMIVDERFRLTEVIGSGCLGVVYRAEQLALSCVVVVKMLQSPVITPAELARFEREAQVLSTLRHRNVVKFYTYGTMTSEAGGEPAPYIGMEFVDGSSLADILKGERLTIRRALGIAAQICEGLRHAHKNGIVHRDLRPSNVFLVTEEGKDVIKVSDFGLARVACSEDSSFQKLIDDGCSLSTLAYISPEQASGQPATPQSDVYALGCLLFECLFAHQVVETTDEIALATQLRRSHIASIILIENSNLPASVRDLLVRTLACDLTVRYKTVDEVLHAIDCCLRGEDASDLDCPVQQGRTDGPNQEARTKSRRNSLRMVALFTIAMSLGALVFRAQVLGLLADSMRNPTNALSYRTPLSISGAMTKFGMPAEANRFFDSAAQQIREMPNPSVAVMSDLFEFVRTHSEQRTGCDNLLLSVGTHVIPSDEFDKLAPAERIRYLKQFEPITRMTKALDGVRQKLIVACLKQATAVRDGQTMKDYLAILFGSIPKENSVTGKIATPCLRTLHQLAGLGERESLLSGTNALLAHAPYRLDAGQLEEFIRAEAEVVEDLLRIDEDKLAAKMVAQITPKSESNLTALAGIRLQVILSERFKDEPETCYSFVKQSISLLQSLVPVSWERMEYERRLNVVLAAMPSSAQRQQCQQVLLDLTRYDAVALLDHANNSSTDFGPTGLSPDAYFYILDNLPPLRGYADARLFSLDELILLARENNRLSNPQLVRVVDELCRAPETFRPLAIHCCEVLSDTLVQKHLQKDGIRLCDAFLKKLPSGELHDRMVFLRNKIAAASRV